MKKFNYTNLQQLNISHVLINTLTKIHEYKGKQALYVATQPETLDKLTDLAIIQSTEYSNKIEGISTSSSRLKKIMKDKATPQNRDEEEIAGYRDVLTLIHDSYPYISVTPNDILTLHKKLYNYSPQAHKGNYKNTDNFITEIDNKGNEKIRFVPAPAYLTPQLLESLCSEFNRAIQVATIDPLLLIPCFILDFLSIHPFSDGNGRMSRLLTLLLLYKSGHLVGKYISIEMIIEQTKTTYYESLEASSSGWAENKQDYTPFVRYLLGIILRSYEDFSERYTLILDTDKTPAERIYSALNNSFEPLSRVNLEMLFPDISQKTIERALVNLQANNQIEKVGKGRATKYQLKHS